MSIITRTIEKASTLRKVGVAAMAALLLCACTTSHTEQDSGVWRPPTGWTPADYIPPVPRIYTADMVSRFDRAFPETWGGGRDIAALAFGLSNLNVPNESGNLGRLRPEDHDALIRALVDAMSLVRVRDGAVMDVEAKRGFFDLSGTERRGGWSFPAEEAVFSLVPEGPLEEGWYVFRVDLTAATAYLDITYSSELRTWQREGDVLFARVYQGSRLMWSHSAFDCSRRDEQCLMIVRMTQPAEQPLTGTIHVRYAGRSVECESSGIPSSSAIGVVCPFTENGTRVEVDFESDMVVDPHGRPLAPGDGVTTFFEVQSVFRPASPDPELGMDIVRGGS